MARSRSTAARRSATPEPDGQWLDASGRVIDESDRGLVYDVRTLVSRRSALGLFGALGAGALVAGCGGTTSTSASGGGTTTASGSTSTSSSSSSASGDLTEVPDETGGPYPGDGSNGVNVLDDSGIVRSDIRSSFGSSTTTAEGVPLTIRLTVRDASTGSVEKGAAVYLWHCNRDGAYSLYAQGLESENYLRGVQSVDADGTVEFTSVYPAAYDGRWPHIHFEVYDGVDTATSSGPIVKTSQIALPQETCEAVYATSGYEASVANLARTSLTSDMVFGDDGGIHQIASMAGTVKTGYTAALTIAV
jgi:protocatechuate 3,4-dioxygenase beta subunit